MLNEKRVNCDRYVQASRSIRFQTILAAINLFIERDFAWIETAIELFCLLNFSNEQNKIVHWNEKNEPNSSYAKNVVVHICRQFLEGLNLNLGKLINSMIHSGV